MAIQLGEILSVTGGAITGAAGALNADEVAARDEGGGIFSSDPAATDPISDLTGGAIDTTTALVLVGGGLAIWLIMGR